jgi:protein-S-isoprenylcysteine O-methyltransferase Ste14
VNDEGRGTAHTQHDRSELAGEHALTDAGQLILYLFFLAAWISDSFVLHYSLLGAALLPLYVRVPLGLAALAGALGLALPAHRAIFGSPDRKPGVVGEGVFSWVRHPMYIGSWLLPVGLTILTGSLASAGVCALILVFYYLVARYEEKLLLDRHGTEYRDYMARVPMFFRIRPREKTQRNRPAG